MPSYRATAVTACATALLAGAVLTGCASSRLSSQMPAGTRLTGDWKLDPAGSDDLGRAVTELREQTRKQNEKLRREREYREAERGQGAGEEMPLPAGPRVSAADELMSSVPQGEYLRIAATDGAFAVTSGASTDQYTPGLESEISAQQGEAQQISGWKGAEYVIDTRPQWGPEIIQSYGLTKEGRLRMTVRLTGGGIGFIFTRLYDRTQRAAPLAPPTNN